MKCIVIGLGIYGSNLAVDLTQAGHQVIGVDTDHTRVDAVKDLISTVYCTDASDETSLSMLPISAVDLVIVAIGENFGSAVRTVALLRKMNVKRIFARAADTLHEAILESFNVERILTPEQRAASLLADETSLGAEVTALKVDSNGTMVMRFDAPEYFHGKPYASLCLEKQFDIKLICATRKVKERTIIGTSTLADEILDTDIPGLRVEPGDTFTVLADEKSRHKLFHTIV